MAALGGNQVSRAFIHYVETGTARPSKQVLAIIARKTGKPVSYFMAPGADAALSGRMLASELVRLAARVKGLASVKSFDIQQRQSLRLLESALRQGAVLTRNLQPQKPGSG